MYRLLSSYKVIKVLHRKENAGYCLLVYPMAERSHSENAAIQVGGTVRGLETSFVVLFGISQSALSIASASGEML